MAGSGLRIYWDACCFLAYINADAKWLATLETLLEKANSGSIEIITSVLSKTEVAFSAMEQVGRALSPGEEERIDKLWSANKGVSVVEYNDLVALVARDIRRGDMMRGWTGKRTADIIHLGTALYMRVDEMHTIDTRLHRYSQVLGFPVKDPFHPQQRLPGV